MPKEQFYEELADRSQPDSTVRELFLKPIPEDFELVQFTVLRNKSGMNKLHPLYTLIATLSNGKTYPCLYAKKKKGTQFPMYTVTLNPSKDSHSSYLGKIKKVKRDYHIFDNGANPKKKGIARRMFGQV